MIYLIDTAPWTEQDVREQCEANGIEFVGGFYFDRTCTRLASVLVKRQVAAQHGVSFRELSTTPAGKPFFPTVQFNISHHDRLLVAIDSTDPVGIDLTNWETPFTPGQEKELWTLTQPTKIASGVFWAAREAYLKYTGEGSRNAPLKMRPPSHTAFPDLENWQWSVMPLMRVENVYVRVFRVRNYVGALVADQKDFEEVSVFSSERSAEERSADGNGGMGTDGDSERNANGSAIRNGACIKGDSE